MYECLCLQTFVPTQWIIKLSDLVDQIDEKSYVFVVLMYILISKIEHLFI